MSAAPNTPSRYRIGLATDWFLPRMGGIELHLADLARALRSRGHVADVLTTTPGESSVTDDGVHRIASTRLPVADLAVSPGLKARMRDALLAGRYEVVHAHVSLVSPTALAAVLAARSLNLATVVTFHSMLLRSASVLRLADRLFGWSTSPIVLSGVSELVSAQVRRAASGRETIVLRNGVDPDVWAPSRDAVQRAPAPRTFVSAMRLHAKKRPLALLEAFARATEGGRRARLVIAGAGPERGRLEAAVARLGLERLVEMPGVLCRPDLAALYRRADAFVMPSIHEAFGLAALEARCAGLPVIAMRAGGSTDFLIDGRTALLADNDAMLAAHMRRLIDDVTLVAQLAGPDPGLARFFWSQVVLDHEACYAAARGLVEGGAH